MNTPRPIQIEGDIAYVQLTKGYVAVIDVADIEMVSGFNWNAHVQAHSVYARRSDYSGDRPRMIYMHRELLGVDEGSEVDHRDGNGLNNRRNNLREARRSQNNQNRSMARNTSSGLKGVSFHKASGKWNARIQSEGKPMNLGFFPSPELAYEAYSKASADLHGEFGRTK